MTQPDDLVKLLCETQILDADQLASVQGELRPRCSDAKALTSELLRRGWLTPYQANHLLQGNPQALVLGPYVFLEKLGEGGMGQVLKARHQKLARIVAIKLIHPDHLANRDTVQRFYREMRVIAQLDHPNIVRAYDADEVNGVHFYSMEYVAGVDLGRLVKREGPLPTARACDFIRQTACGLQHAFERGLIHRDLKPVNLLACEGQTSAATQDGAASFAVRPAPLVKILDLGLARIDKTKTAMDESGTLTQEGMLMGTPDYMSPEQAVRPKAVDIRSDLYSLGCTFYYLLTGCVPFPNRSLTDKLLAHQMDQPPPIEQFRPDIPDELSAVVYRLMEKKPADRYQTPAEVAAVLADLMPRLPAPSTIITPRQETRITAAPAASMTWTSFLFSRLRPVVVVNRPTGNSLSGQAILAVAMVLTLVVCVGLLVVLLLNSGNGPPRPAVKDPAVATPRLDTVKPLVPHFPPGPVTDAWIAHVRTLSPSEQVRMVFAKLRELNEGFDVDHKDNFWEERDGEVVRLQWMQPVTDVSPVHALKKLETLDCRADFYLNSPPPVSLADVSQLRQLPLKHLNLQGNRLDDITPLSGMKLESLSLENTRVQDISVLKAMTSLKTLRLGHTPITGIEPLRQLTQLRSLSLIATNVEDLTPLAGIPLDELNLDGTRVHSLAALDVSALRHLSLISCSIEDLSPLAKAEKLRSLYLEGVPAQSLEPLKNLALEHLTMGYEPRHEGFLRALVSLKIFNRQSMDDFWKVVGPDPVQEQWRLRVAGLPPAEQRIEVANRLAQLNPNYGKEPKFTEEAGAIVELDLLEGPLQDLRPVAALGRLRRLRIRNTSPILCNLEPLRGLPLNEFSVSHLGHFDPAPLAGMPLEKLWVRPHSGHIYDFTAIHSLRSLRQLHIEIASMLNSSFLADMPQLESLVWRGGRPPLDIAKLKNLKSLATLNINCDFTRHREVLRSLTLKTLNGKTPDDFWKEIAQQEAEFVRRELVRLNGPLEKIEAQIEDGRLVGLHLNFIDKKRDLRPLAGLKDLKSLVLVGGKAWSEPFSLEPLRGLRLETLQIGHAVPESLAPLEGMKLASLYLHHTGFKDVSTIKGLSIERLSLISCGVADLAPLRGQRLKQLVLNGTKIEDLSPVRGMPLELVSIQNCPKISDLGPLQEAPLADLYIARAPVRDLSPLRDMKSLRRLTLIETSDVIDLSPLAGLGLEKLSLEKVVPIDLTPLKKSPLKSISFEFEPFRGDADVLRAIPTLQTINGKKAAEFLKEADDRMAVFQGWCDEVAKQPAEKQAEMVAAKLKERNPAMTAAVTPTIKEGRVMELHLSDSIALRDMSPVRALTSLRSLTVGSSGGSKKGDWTNLHPLRGMQLEVLRIGSGEATDLWPLQDMKTLTSLCIRGSKVSDLSPLRGLPLKYLQIYGNPVHDLSPLEGMNLEHLICTSTRVKDLSPLQCMPLKQLHLSPLATDLSALKGIKLRGLYAGAARRGFEVLKDMPLERVDIIFVPWRDSALLRSIKTLKQVNHPPIEYRAWADWEDAVRAAPPEKHLDMVKAKLIEINGPATEVTGVRARQNDADKNVTELECLGDFKDISPVRVLSKLEALHLGRGKQDAAIDISSLTGIQLKKLAIHDASAVDWAVLRELPLEEFEAHGKSMTSLEPLRGLQLKVVKATYSKVNNLEPLRGMPLQVLEIGASEVSDLSPLADMKLTWISISSSKVSDISVLKGMPLEYFRCGSGTTDLSPLRGAPLKVLYLNQHPGPRDWSPLLGLPIEEYTGPVAGEAALEFLRSCRKTLRTINGKAAEEFTLCRAGSLQLGPRRGPVALTKRPMVYFGRTG